jgi:hypothetical protein
MPIGLAFKSIKDTELGKFNKERSSGWIRDHKMLLHSGAAGSLYKGSSGGARRGIKRPRE